MKWRQTMTVRRAGHGSEGELVRVGQGRGTREEAQVGEYMWMDGCVRGAWIGIEVGRVRRVMKPMVQVEWQSARGGSVSAEWKARAKAEIRMAREMKVSVLG
jgi:hypothetical protein